MTAVYPSEKNVFIRDHDASNKMVIDYARNINDFAVNRYVQVVPAEKVAYASPSDMIDRYDGRTIEDLLSDSGEPIADIASDQKLAALLEAASGRVEAAVLVANHYTLDELTSLSGNSLALLKDIVCDLAMARLLRRRPEKMGGKAVEAITKEAEEYLDRLRNGDRLFDIAAHKDAGLPTVTGPTAMDYARLNLIPDRTKHFYPSRARRLPLGR